MGPTDDEIAEIMETNDVGLQQAVDIWQIMYAEANQEIKETGLIVKELSTIADRFDKSKSVHLKVPKGKKGWTSPVVCGYCGSSYKQEVEK